MQRLIVIGLLAIGLTACATYTAPDDSGELCASEVRPPVLSSEENPEIVAPTVIRRVEPQLPGSLFGRSAIASVETIIGIDGIPANICIVSGDREYGRALAAALQQWRFKPGTLNGEPIPVKFTLKSTLTRGMGR